MHKIIAILRNGGLLTVNDMIVKNYTFAVKQHILMCGTWFDLKNANYGNEQRIFDEDIKMVRSDDTLQIFKW